MILLNSADRAVDYATLDPDSKKVNFFSEDQAQIVALSAVTGLFSLLDGSLVVLYRDEQALKLMLEREVYVIDETTRSEFHRGKRRLPGLKRFNDFRLFQNEELVLSFHYRAPLIQRFAFDPTPFVEDEHFDFMLFTHNVLRDPERRGNIWLDNVR